MYRVPQPGPRQPAVGGPVVQRRVRPRPPDCARRVLVIVLTADRSRFSAQTEVGTLGFNPPRYRTTMYRCAGCGGPTNWLTNAGMFADDCGDEPQRRIFLVLTGRGPDFLSSCYSQAADIGASDRHCLLSAVARNRAYLAVRTRLRLSGSAWPAPALTWAPRSP